MGKIVVIGSQAFRLVPHYQDVDEIDGKYLGHKNIVYSLQPLETDILCDDNHNYGATPDKLCFCDCHKTPTII